MDRVRFGRVLGRGARLAAQTAYQALDAATAPSPKPTSSHVRQAPVRTPEILEPRRATAPRMPTTTRVRQQTAGVFTPLRKATHSVSLEVMGSFFALFALSFSVGVWHQREQLHAGRNGVAHFVLFCLVTGFFAYCSVSSFVRARRVR